MKIKCIANAIDPKIHSEEVVNWAKKSELEITIGEGYVVLAISKYFNTFFFYIISDVRSDYPLAFPATLFEITDKKISKYWTIDLRKVDSLSQMKIDNNDVVSFKEWASKGSEFYENLLEEKNEEVRIFKTYKDLMLAE